MDFIFSPIKNLDLQNDQPPVAATVLRMAVSGHDDVRSATSCPPLHRNSIANSKVNFRPSGRALVNCHF